MSMFRINQKQKSGDNSYNIQGQNVMIGVSATEARQIAMDVFEANFYRISELAANKAKERAEKLLDNYLSKIEAEKPSVLSETQNPDMQYAIFTAQKEFARTGDDELGELLVQLLVERTKEDKRNLVQVVLNESLEVAPKLMPDQMDVLSIVFLLKYTGYNGMTSLKSIGSYIDKFIIPFIQNLNKKRSTYQHLEFASCGNISIGETKIENIFLNTYPGLFCKGLSEEQIKSIPENARDILIPCLHSPEKLQISALNNDVLDNILKQKLLSNEDREIIKKLFLTERMSEIEVKEFLLQLRPGLFALFDVWDNSSMKNMTLTSVGITIAHANIQRRIGEKFDLSIWI